MRVEVADVDVVVTDRQGRPVEGLTREDFELRLDGEKQAIENFYAVERGRRIAGESLALEGESAAAARFGLVTTSAIRCGRGSKRSAASSGCAC